MAAPTTFTFGKGTFWLGDGAGSETFTKICGFSDISLTFEKGLNDTTVPDCDDPDAPAWLTRDVVSLSGSAKFSGVLAKTALPLLESAFLSATSRNCKIRLVGASATGGATPDRLITGKFHIKHDLSGKRGERWSVSVTADSDGTITIADAAAAS